MAAEEPDKKGTDEAARDELQGGPAPGLELEEDELDFRIKQAIEAALDEQKDTVLRAQAEVQNMRRRCEQDVEKAHKFALERFASDLVSVADNLESALATVPDSGQDNVNALYEGVELTLKGFLETLKKYQIEQLDPVGEPFDPQLHEAMSMQVNDEVEANTVLAVMQKGYTLNGRVIRPARVIVAKAG